MLVLSFQAYASKCMHQSFSTEFLFSALYVFSAMGFYPVCPATDQYVIGSPLFKRINVQLENGKHFSILAANNSGNNVYINNSLLNRKPLQQNWISHQAIQKGGVLSFRMQASPNVTRGVRSEDAPYSRSKEAAGYNQR